MPRYGVYFTYVDSGRIEIEAESEIDAIATAQSQVSQWDATHRDCYFDAFLAEEDDHV